MNESMALLKKDLRKSANLWRVLREQPLFKLCFISLFAAAIITGMWLLFLHGFNFLDKMGGVGLLVVHRLFGLFFFSMGAMLALSSVVTSYTTVFRSDEISYLLLQPLSCGQIVLHKLLESAAISSWAFFFIAIPFVGAFAQHESLSPLFVLWTFVFSLPFVMLYSGIGTLVTLLIVRIMPNMRIVGILVLTLAVVAIFHIIRSAPPPGSDSDETTFVLTKLVPGMHMATNPLWPSTWVADGITALSHRHWAKGGMLLATLLSNVMLVGLAAYCLGQTCFYDAWQKVVADSSATSRHGVLLRPLEKMLRLLPEDMRGLIMKDIRTLLRDPVQWTQGFLFFGLLGLYFINLRSFNYHMLSPMWRNLIAFLNVFSLSAVMCSFCSRFVYPQLSLEGQGFWIVGMSPTTMGRVLTAKYIVSVTIMLIISLLLMYVSTYMLKVEPMVMATALCISCAMSFALCGLSTGLGAVFMDLKQKNPSAIISGFGGTLNLVLSLTYMMVSVAPFGIVFHLYYNGTIKLRTLHTNLVLLALCMLPVTIVAVLAPLMVARKSMVDRDY